MKKLAINFNIIVNVQLSLYQVYNLVRRIQIGLIRWWENQMRISSASVNLKLPWDAFGILSLAYDFSENWDILSIRHLKNCLQLFQKLRFFFEKLIEIFPRKAFGAFFLLTLTKQFNFWVYTFEVLQPLYVKLGYIRIWICEIYKPEKA